MTTATPETKHSFVFVVKLIDGRYAIGSANNVAHKIAALNSGLLPQVKKSLQVSRIIGVKDINNERNLPSVVSKFVTSKGLDRVVVL